MRSAGTRDTSPVSFRDRELRRLTQYAKEHWGCDAHVIPYEVANETLQADVRQTALEYFQQHDLRWWTSRWDRRCAGTEPRPTGHLNSSQVACVNHLEPARIDGAVSAMVFKNLGLDLVPEALEDGYVEYEWIGGENYLGEGGPRVRGANVTSLDALMLGTRGPRRVLIVIEWKYLETYGVESVAVSHKGIDRIETYRPLLQRSDSPITVQDLGWLFHEPYYQLMRQTLLAWQMVEHHDFGANDWIHLQVVPMGNEKLRGRGGAPEQLLGSGLAEVWRSVLHEPARYRLVTPGDVAGGMKVPEHWRPWRGWLRERYLT